MARWRWVGLMATLALAAACGGASAPGEATTSPETAELTGTVTFFAYEDAFDPHLLGPFEEANPDLTVRTAAFASGDEAITKLRGGFRADVINVCIEDTPRMVALGLLQPIDTTRIEAWDRMFPSLRSMAGVTVDGEVYVVPMVGGTTGILYDAEAVPEGIHAYRDLFDPRFAGRIALGSDALTNIAIAAMALGYEEPLALDENALAEVERFLIAHKGDIRTFFRGDADVMNLFESGEIVAAAPGYPGISNLLKEQGVPVEFSLAEEGQLTWVCGYGIGAAAENVDAAYALINHYAQPEIQAYQARKFQYLVSNQDTLAVLSDAIVRAIGMEHPEQLQAAIPYVIPENYDRWQEVWSRVRAA
ncbi:MAG: spermidine/putrescine ABC transporter [Actinomycetota bacterium]|nr:MAG: spermidine/putrescine ABC transporter [Actinomycetota bacterium]